jgi:beta-glucuronidase
MLYPRESESRELKELNGLWEFQADPGGAGRAAGWFRDALPDPQLMAVPASYNDLTQDAALRDHVGEVWYTRRFFVPATWRGQRVVLRVGSACHHATVWVNGTEVARHKGGYMPFEAELSDHVTFGGENRVTIAVSNVLDWTTLPPGDLMPGQMGNMPYPPGYRVQEYYHDFFNYAGLHRAIRLYTTPAIHIRDLAVRTAITGSTGEVQVTTDVAGGNADVTLCLRDGHGREVATGRGVDVTLTVDRPRLWEPGQPHLYELEVTATSERGRDVYRLPVGIRTVEVKGDQFLLNGKPFYFRGFGMHEDADLRGKGHDPVNALKDFNLLRWIGANSFRTSHYPYAEEILQLADRLGFLVIDETPAVGFYFFGGGRGDVFAPNHAGAEMQAHHLHVVREMVARDRNHPCVVMWSVANESATQEAGARAYFEPIFEEVRRLDPTRPVTLVQCIDAAGDTIGDLCDVICVNRYYGWYSDCGHLEVVTDHLTEYMKAWHARYHKPLFLTEYGADTLAGSHADPPVMFTEEYQVEFLKRCHAALDGLPFIIGEHVWNFADFATKQGTTRVIGNRKGVFTRQRQPKMAAHELRARWSKK